MSFQETEEQRRIKSLPSEKNLVQLTFTSCYYFRVKGVMPPSSGELWGHHLMPTSVQIDFLLPNGVLIDMPCFRDATLEKIKVYYAQNT